MFSSSSSTKHSTFCLKMPKIVPVATAACTLLEPSSGSKTATYLLPKASSTNIGSASSSDAAKPTLPVYRKASFKTSLAIISNCFCCSSCTLMVSAAPSKPSTPARCTMPLIVLHPIAIDERRASRSSWLGFRRVWSRSHLVNVGVGMGSAVARRRVRAAPRSDDGRGGARARIAGSRQASMACRRRMTLRRMSARLGALLRCVLALFLLIRRYLRYLLIGKYLMVVYLGDRGSDGLRHLPLSLTRNRAAIGRCIANSCEGLRINSANHADGHGPMPRHGVGLHGDERPQAPARGAPGDGDPARGRV